MIIKNRVEPTQGKFYRLIVVAFELGNLASTHTAHKKSEQFELVGSDSDKTIRK